MLQARSAPRNETRSRNAIALDEIEHPMVRKALEVWNTARGGRAMPAKADLGPRALLPVLKNTALLKVIDGGEEFVFRIVGDQIRVQQGVAVQGKTMSEIDEMLPGHGSLLRRIYRGAVAARAPLAFRGWYLRPADQHPFCHEVVILPVSEDGETVDHLFVVAA
ncbi:MAG: PAS domain-containing protein [Alphaproteobacteria bacterium]|nr:PAS domain-containing protein [Alphaproteobacteria bacterium]MBV9692067.1 PAS domain-containing protein [Alphaproteobacteria bacterium]